MQNPEVSVIIPAYNASKYIEQAIDSVYQQNVPVEVIVVNDCSTDNVDFIISKYENIENFVYVKNGNNMGVAKSRNIGVNLAKGDYIAFLDADDWWRENKLKKQLEVIKKYNCDLCFTGREIVYNDGKTTGMMISVKRYVTYRQLLHHNSIATSSVLLKKSVALKNPMKYSEYHEDYITWLNILKSDGLAVGINEMLLFYRLSKEGKSRNKYKSLYMTYRVYRVIGIGNCKSIYFTSSHLMHSIIKYFRSIFIGRFLT